MKASELRIGNKIKFIDDGTIFTVVSIDLKGAGLENTSEFAWIEFESLEPIPLTEEWLLKFGFQEGNRGYYLKRNVVISVEGEVYFGDSDTWIASIYYVHHIQNLYFALECEELTLNES